MIRLANEQDFARAITSESELRICALKRAYGLNAPFIHFFADGEGSLASIMDRFCTFHCTSEPNEEWCTFLQMHPDIRTIHTEERIAAILAKKYGAILNKGMVMRFGNASSKWPLHDREHREVSLREVYAVLSAVFDDFPPFDGWYVDASHRVRHDCCRIAFVSMGERMISTAMTVAETEDAALIGAVATLPEYRAQGAATKCITALIGMLPQQVILIAPKGKSAEQLYKKLGFVPWGTWAELRLP